MPITYASVPIVAGLLGSTIGISLFGIIGIFVLFVPIALILLVASAFGGPARSDGNPSGIGLIVGFMVLLIAMLAFNAAMA